MTEYENFDDIDVFDDLDTKDDILFSCREAAEMCYNKSEKLKRKAQEGEKCARAALAYQSIGDWLNELEELHEVFQAWND